MKADLDRFIDAYIECALWSSTEGVDDTSMDENYTRGDIAESSMKLIRTDCERFTQEQHAVLDYVDSIGEHGDTYAMAGHDFWLTRNGHGAGFWDGDWDITLPALAGLQNSGQSAGDVLTDATHKFGPCDLYIGDDERVYVFPDRLAYGASEQAGEVTP